MSEDLQPGLVQLPLVCPVGVNSSASHPDASDVLDEAVNGHSTDPLNAVVSPESENRFQ